MIEGLQNQALDDEMNHPRKACLLGIDIGTTSTKAVLFAENGKELARATSKSYQNLSPKPGWMEQDPEEIWQAVLSVLNRVMAQVENVQVAAVCMAAQSGSLLPANAQGDPVYNLITWMDGRTEALVASWKASGLQERVKSVSGWSLYPGLPLPTIAWLRENDPEVFAAAQHFFSVNDFIAHRLTGEKVSNPSNGGGMQLVDIRTADWHPDLCALAGISPAQLSRIQPAGSVIGEIRPKICAQTGLTPGAVLVNGGHDQVITALGLGITDPGKLLLACGTAWVFTGVTEACNRERVPASLDLNHHVPPHRWTVSQSLGGLGASLEWWREQAWKGTRRERFAAMDQELAETRPNEQLFFIPLTGGHDDPATTRPGGFVGLQLVHNRADMARAIMESAGFELRRALEALRAAQIPIERLWMVGGAAGSSHWPAILVNITGIPILLPAYENWPALGAALLAGIGVGIFDGISDALAYFGKPARDILPDAGMMAFYDGNYAAYQVACTQVWQIPGGRYTSH
jgi:xylulokinase